MGPLANVSGLFFFGALPPSGSGFVVAPDGLDGLDDGVAEKGNVVARSQAHGDFDLPTFLESRIVSLSGTCLAGSPGELAHFGRMFTGLLVGASGSVVFNHLGATMWGNARPAPGTQRKFKVDPTNSTEAAFQLQLKFANPRLYGDGLTFPNANYSLSQIHHRGNFKASPVITVTGSAPSGYTLNLPGGKKYIVTLALVAGTPHVIDMADGYLRVNGLIISNSATRADLIAISGGAQVAISVTPVSGSASLSVLLLDTFM